jgi:Divergent InlB B-repeat domain
MNRTWTFILAVGAMIAASACGHAQAQNSIPPPQIVPPLTRPQVQYYQQNPQEYQQLRDRLSQQAGQQPLAVRKLAPAETPSAGSWTTLTNSPGVTLQNPLLLTDGTVIASQECTGNWYRLTPDNTGSYINGTWSQIASLPSGYAPLFHGSGVLPDGRVIIAGGEYNGVSGNCGSPVDTNNAAIYDPVANVWTSVSPPSGWSHIGDAESVILDNGTYMQANCCDNIAGSFVAALLNATNLTWTATGTNKADRYDEEGFAKLHDGTVLDVDAHTSGSCGMNSEIYNPATGAWSSAGNTIHQEADCSNPGGKPSFELGPLVVRPDGSAVIFPGVTCSDVANTSCQNKSAGFVVTGTADIYTPGSGWASGPVIPTVGTAPNNYPYTLADAPAAVLPDGNVLFAASPSYQTFVAPTHFFELNFSNNTITQVGDTADAANCGAYVHNFLLLPGGQVLDVSQCGNLQIYTPLAGASQASWAPVITSVPSALAPGANYAVSGSQLNGLTEGTYYGDDVQAATNFPLVRITNNSTGHVFYARTSNHGTMSIAPNAAGSTNFAVPANIEMGASSLVVVANGIPSQPIAVNISNSAVLTVSVTGSGTVTSNPAGINCPSTCSAGFSLGANVTLTATATSGWVFSGWSGACSGTGGCTVTMSTAQSVTATFTQLPTLTVSVTGSGTVTSSPPGISCPSTCSASFASGTQVTLTATPASGWKFNGWSGACGGTGTCSVTMNSAQSVTATFVQLTYPLAVSLTGSGSVSSNPAGISCPSTCSASFNSGTPVTLTATPAPGMSFIGWSGACSGTGGCSVTMSAAESVSAAFTTNGDPANGRTWVSATSGSDSNPCTRVSPCLSFAAALAQTPAGGEIDVLDPGDFGPVTITKSVTINGDAPGIAGLIPSPGTSGIVISAGASDVINLRGLVFDGVNASGTSDVVFTSGARLSVNQCVFLGFATSGMTLSPGVGGANTTLITVQNTTIVDNATGILIQPTGGIAANVRLRRLRIDHNTGDGLRADGTGGTGAINVAIADSSANFNAGNGIDAVSGPGNAAVDVMRVVAAGNGSAGIQSNQTNGGIASVTVGNSQLHKNAIGIQATGGASLLTYGNNHVIGNAANGSFTGAATPQ